MIRIEIDNATGAPTDLPVRLALGRRHTLRIAFQEAGLNALKPEGTSLSLALYLPGDMDTPISGTAVTAWTRQADSEDYRAEIDLTAPALVALGVATLYGRITYTEPEEAATELPRFHVRLSAGPAIERSPLQRINSRIEGLAGVIDPETGKIATDKLPELIIAGLRQGTKAELDAADPTLNDNEPAWETDTQVFRVGDKRYSRAYMATDQSITAYPGDDLIQKYNEAKALTPGGNALAADNRAKLVIHPGDYALSSTLTLDTDFVDVIGLGSTRQSPKVLFTGNSISVPDTVTDCRIVGLSVGDQAFIVEGLSDPANDDRFFENCVGGRGSFGSGFTSSGTKRNGSSTFDGCVSNGKDSFGGAVSDADASGTFRHCIGEGACFGGAASGGKASGLFEHCVAGGESFGGSGGDATGTFRFCVSTGSDSFAGKFLSGGNASGTFEHCVSGSNGFGGNGTLSGKLYYCRLTSGTFTTVSGDGITRLCIDGNDAENNQG